MDTLRITLTTSGEPKPGRTDYIVEFESDNDDWDGLGGGFTARSGITDEPVEDAVVVMLESDSTDIRNCLRDAFRAGAVIEMQGVDVTAHVRNALGSRRTPSP